MRCTHPLLELSHANNRVGPPANYLKHGGAVWRVVSNAREIAFFSACRGVFSLFARNLCLCFLMVSQIDAKYLV